ncbi:MAG: sugar transferase [Plesiomonas shigelloides]
MIRLCDVILSMFGLFFLWPVLLLIAIIGYFDSGSPVFLQTRVGRNQNPFTLIKFRTMPLSTASVATHLVDSTSITAFGHFLRKTKLDELPQLINVFKGDMSLVGPRPCLFNQIDVIRFRQGLGVYKFRPGITGLAQVNNIDMSTPELLAKMDSDMMVKMKLSSYFKYIFMTVSGMGQGDNVRPR